MQLISRKAFRFADTTLVTDADGNVECKERAAIIVQPTYRPTEVPDWAKDDPTFKAAVACGDVEIL
jgi:hypothetical protein